MYRPVTDVNSSESKSRDHSIELPPLNFINIEGNDACVRSLVDGGSEINVLRSNVTSQLSIGEVMFKGIVVHRWYVYVFK